MSDSETLDGARPVAVTCIVVSFDNVGRKSVRICTSKIFIQPIADSPMSSFDDRAFHVGIFTYLKLDALAF